MNVSNINMYKGPINSMPFNRKPPASKAGTVISVVSTDLEGAFSPSKNYLVNKYRGNDRKLMMGYFGSATDKEVSSFEEAHSLKYLKAFDDSVKNGDKNFVSNLADKYAELYEGIQYEDFATEDEKNHALEILDKTYGYMAESVTNEVGEAADKSLNAAANYLTADKGNKALNKISAFSEFEKVFDFDEFKEYVKNLSNDIKKHIVGKGGASADEFIDKAAKGEDSAFEHMSAKELKHIGRYVYGDKTNGDQDGLSKRFKNTLRKSEVQLNLAKNAEETMNTLTERKDALGKRQQLMEGYLKDFINEEQSPFKAYGGESASKSVNASIDKLLKDAEFDSDEAEELKKMVFSFNLEGAGEAYKNHLSKRIDETKKQIRGINLADKDVVFGSGESKYNKHILNGINAELRD